MCRKPALAATALALLMLASPALAWGGKKADAKKTEAKPAAAAPAQHAAPPKATAADRAAVERQDPLARAAFWARILDADPRDVEAGLKLSKALREMGRNQDAASIAQQVLVVQSNSYEGLLELARAHIGAGAPFFALEPLNQAAALNPKDWRPLSLAAIAYEATRQPDEATAAFNAALKLAPDTPALLTNHALFLAARGQTQAAEADARRAVSLPGSGAKERQNLALVLGLAGRFDEAEKLIRRDLPPDQADANLAYLRGVSNPANRNWADVQRTQQ